jgi:hypothetical protein
MGVLIGTLDIVDKAGGKNVFVNKIGIDPKTLDPGAKVLNGN